MSKLKLLPLLPFFFAVSLSPSCSESGSSHSCGLTGVEEIIDEVLKHKLFPSGGCEQHYDDHYDKDTFSSLFYSLAIPPFDTMPCYTSVFLYNSTIKTFTEVQCVVVDMGALDSVAINKYFPLQSIGRAQVYLGGSKEVLDETLDCAKLDFSRMGGSVLCSGEPCGRKYSSPSCLFSEVYIDASGERAIIYLVMMGEYLVKNMFYFQKIGQKWVLTVKEDADGYIPGND
jgi:hypothetical protein